MKCKALCYLLCVLFCFSSLGLSSSAADESSGGEASYPLVEDLIEEGFVEDEAGDYVFYGENVPFNNRTFLLSSKNFPDFDIKSLPWLSFPAYVKEIINIDTGSYIPLFTDDGSGDSYCFDRIPFILVRPYTSNLVEVYAGYNIAIGSYNDADRNVNIFASPGSFYNGSVCYFARYDFDGNVVIDWKQLPLNTPFNNKSIGYYQTYAIGNLTRVSDYYFWGGNAIKPSSGGVTSFSIFTVPGDSSSTTIQGYQSVDGFRSGNYFYFQNSYENAYCTTFTPPTEEELVQETQKGIWDTLKSVLSNIKSLPSNIANSIKGFFTSLGDRISGFFTKLVEDIKGLFVPDEDYFDTYAASFQEYFKDKFGLLYEIPESIISILTQLVSFEPDTDNYGIDFPEVKMPILQDGKWEKRVLIEETRVSFDFIYDNSALLSLYILYTTVLKLIFIFLLINLIIRKANKVFGGGYG